MSRKINIMDVNVDICSAKEALKTVMECFESEPVSVIEMLTGEMLLQLDMVPEVKRELSAFDLVLAGETTFLEVAGITEKRYLQETGNRTFLKMFLRYLHKSHIRTYLLAETEEELNDFEAYLQEFYRGIQVVGMIEVYETERADDMIVNLINGSEAECVLSVLSSPLQEEFVVKNRTLMNTRIFMNLGKEILPVCKKKMKHSRLTQFLMKRILKKEIEKSKKNGGI